MKHHKFFLSVLFFVLLFSSVAGQNILFVDKDATGGNNGSSWADAYITVYEALAASAAGDSIWVAAGTYHPELDATPRLSTFIIDKQIALFGGFDGTETMLGQRDFTTNETILSGDIGVQGDSTDNTYHVISFESHNTDIAILDGFTIQHGNASPSGGTDVQRGGAVWMVGEENKTIANCTFRNNTALDNGGAIFMSSCKNIRISNCHFYGNNQSSTIGADFGGGAISSLNSVSGSFEIDSCIFENNTAVGHGGAIYADNTGIITNSFFVNNSCKGGSSSGGAVYHPGNISNCRFESNKANAGHGGAIVCSWKVIKNSLFIDNMAALNGGAIHKTNGGQIINCTFAGNHGHNYGGAICDEGTATEIVNCIFSNNIQLLSSENSIYNLASNPFNVTYSCTPESIEGNGNITADPDFVSDSTFYLAANSPCIDAGNGDIAPTTDLDGKLRQDDIGVHNTGAGTPNYTDMGVFEFQGNSALNGEYSIGSTGDFASFTAAIDSLISLGISDSVVFNVATGTYTEQVVIPEISGASDSAAITFQSASGDSTDVMLTYAATLENENYTLKLDGADYITFKNMTLQATGATYARVVEVTNETKHIGFLNNRFEGVENTGELVCNINNPVKRDSSIVFSNNCFLNGKKAIQWNSSYNMSITDNMFYHQHDTAVFMVYGRESSIKNNLFYSNHRATAILLYEHMTDFSIEKNQVYLKNGGRGIDIDGRGDNNTLINNYLYIYTTQPDIGIQMYSSFGMTVQMLHNTIHIAGDNESTICYNDPNIFYEITLQSNNNNFVNTAGGFALSGSYVYGDYNNLYSNGPYLVNDRINLEILQLEDNKELNSVSVNPHFVADTSWTPAHPELNNSGLDVGIAEDIEGNARNVSNPDMGAAEFTPPPPVPFHGNYIIGGATPDFVTLNDAVDALIMNGIDGSVVFSIAADTLYENVRIPEIDGASATNIITFTSASSDTAVLQSNHRYTIFLDGADFITFDRLKILNNYASSHYYPSNVILANGANNNQFTNNYFTRENPTNSHLIHIQSSVDTNIVIASNIFEDTRSGIYFEGNDTVIENGNQIINNTFYNLSSRCIHMNRQQQFLISGNKKNDGVDISHGIAVTGSKNGLISNNMLNSKQPYETVGLDVTGCDSLKIYYNTIKHVKGTPLKLDGSNLDVKNNILVTTGFNNSIICNDSTGFVSDYNVFYSNSSLNKMNWLGKNLGSLEAWQDSSGNDANSLWLIPEFVSDDDLHITDILVNQRGTPLPEVSVDIDGEARDPLHPDIGADEVDLGVPMAGEYYIGPSRQFTSFTEAIDSVVQVSIADSITFLVDEGTYNEQVVIPHIPNITPERPVVFRPAPENTEDVIIEYLANNTDHYVIKLDSAQHITLENMTINALDTLYATAIYMVNGTHDVTVTNNIITSEKNPQTSAFKVEDGNNYNIRVSGNTITGGFNGIDFKGEEGNPSPGNIITENTLLNQYHSGIFMQYQKWQHISKNRVSHPDPIENIWIGIDLYDCTAEYDSLSYIVNNMIDYDATRQSAGLAMFNCLYQNIYHNNIHVHGSSSESRTLNLQDGCSNIYTYNNILSNSAGGVLIYAPDLNAKHFDYNVLHTTEDRFIYVGGWIDNLTAWNTAGMGVNSLTLDPLFVSDTDLHIAQIQLFGKGMSIPEITGDFDSDARDPENTTIGADVMTGTCTEPLSGVIPIGTGETYESVNDAVMALILCGMEGTVVFEMAPGTYNEQVYFSEKFTGKTPEDSIIFRSASGNAEDVIITYDATKNNNYVIKLDGLDNFVLQNVTLEAQNSRYGRLIEISNHVNNSLFDGNIFKGIENQENNDSLVLVYYLPESVDSSQVFMNNTFINGSRAIVKTANPVATDLLEIRKNEFINQGYGLINYRRATLMLFEENRVKANTTSYQCIKALYVDSASIRKNIVTIYALGGYFNRTLNKTVLENNYISFHSTGNEELYLIYPGSNLYLYYNTLVISGLNENSRLYQLNGNSCDQLVQLNNVMANLAHGKIYNIYFGIPTVVSDHNNLFTNGESFGKLGGSTYDRFQDYVSATGLDANSVSANPAFLNDSTWYSQHILHSNTGTPIAGITTDLDGNPRDAATPDMGAEEFETVRYGMGEDVRACAGDEVVLNAGVGFESYAWSTGSDSSTTVIDTLGTGMGPRQVWVTVGLNGNQYIDTITVDLNLPVANPVTDYCYNENEDSIMISAGEGVEYLWSNGKRTQSFYITGGNWYYVTVTDEYGCSSDGSVQIHYNECVANVDMPGDSVITENDSIVIESNQCRYDYERFDYSWNTGDTTYLVTLYGSELGIGTHEIVVTVTNYGANGCTSSDTLMITVDEASGITNNELSDNIQIYPNPTTGKVVIKNPLDPVTGIKIYDLQGNLILEHKEKSFELDLSGQKAGMYLIWVETHKSNYIQKIMLK